MMPRNRKPYVAPRKRDVETAQILPATAKLTMDNAATPLLKLPQEVKNMIYEHVLPAHEVIYVDYSFPGPGSVYTMSFVRCRETAEHHSRFSLSLGEWHELCYTTESQGPHGQYPTLDLALLSTCRQTYAEAKYTLYVTNAFAFRCWDVLHEFIRKYGKGTAANNLPIRNISLFINVEDRRDEECWNKVFKYVTRKLPALKNVCVTVDDRYCLSYPFNGKEIFLDGILKLRDLQLSSFVLDVIKGERSELDRVWISERMSPAQRVDWANYVKSAIMGPETNTVAR
ncbi:hypothetical protein BDR22DRAFT_669971 [Usnea florida]